MKSHCKEICEGLLSNLRLDLIDTLFNYSQKLFCQTSSRTRAILTEYFRSLTEYFQHILKHCLALGRCHFLLRNFKCYFLLSKYLT